jgi:hypothetical protein
MIENYLIERDARELLACICKGPPKQAKWERDPECPRHRAIDWQNGPDDPKAAIKYWQLAANHANEENDRLASELQLCRAEICRLITLNKAR